MNECYNGSTRGLVKGSSCHTIESLGVDTGDQQLFSAILVFSLAFSPAHAPHPVHTLSPTAQRAIRGASDFQLNSLHVMYLNRAGTCQRTGRRGGRSGTCSTEAAPIQGMQEQGGPRGGRPQVLYQRLHGVFVPSIREALLANCKFERVNLRRKPF
jgi:hypothetical protein